MVPMEKEGIIKKFLENGYQLDKESLNFFYQNQEKIREFFEKIKGVKEVPIIISLNFLEKIGFGKKKFDIVVLKQPKEEEKTFTVNNLIDIFAQRYENFKKILANRLDLVNLISINKITARTKKFSLIAIVREKDEEEKSLLLEDTTGEIKCFFEGSGKNFNTLVEDEVIGVVCESREGRVFIKKIFFPDIPLKRKINKASNEAYCIFISGLDLDKKNFKKEKYEKFLNWIKKMKDKKLYIIVLGGVSKDKKQLDDFFASLPLKSFKLFLKSSTDPETKFSNLTVIDPCFLKIEGLNFLICNRELLSYYQKIWPELKPVEILLNLLKKRHLNPFFEKRTSENAFFIDIIPDVFVAGGFAEGSSLNYKGTTIIAVNSFFETPIVWMLNLMTREVIKIDFT